MWPTIDGLRVLKDGEASPSYQKAESFRDGEIEQSRRFLMQKGLPTDFLERIPPLKTMEQTRASIARIQSIVRD